MIGWPLQIVTSRQEAVVRGSRAGCDTASFRIGVVPVTIRSDDEGAFRAFCDLYHEMRLEEPAPESIDVRVRRTRNGKSLRRRYEVWADGARRFAVWDRRSILPHMEWSINWHIMLYLPRYYQVHASALEVGGAGVIFPAAPQSGKSTLAAGMVQRGARYLSDEFALIDPETLELAAYPKALCIKEGSFSALEATGVKMATLPVYLKGKKGAVRFIRPDFLSTSATTPRPCRVGHIMFCRYRPGATPEVRSISRADALLRLARQSFNFVKFRSAGVNLMADVVRSAECYELTSGDLGRTCDLVLRTVGA